MIKVLATFLFLGLMVPVGARELTLDECYRLAEQHYPLVRQQELIRQTRDYTVENAARGYWPQLQVAGQATYQSAVTELPVNMPGITPPQLSKDQYKVYAEVTQTIYDNGVIRNQQKLAENAAQAELQRNRSELYKLRERINQLYFGILVIDAQLAQNELLRSDIQAGLDKVNAAITNGTAFRSNADVLKAQLLQNGQRRTELESGRRAYADMLSLFTGTAINDATVLAMPPQPELSDEIVRPELSLYELQKAGYEQQQKLLNARSLPRFNLFAQGGAGRPALNFLSNDFEGYYIGGLRLNWNIGSYYTLSREKKVLSLNKEMADVQRDVFLFQTRLGMKQYNAEVRRYRELLATDEEIVTLRNNVKKAAAAQLSNDVITPSDYLREVNNEDRARQDQLLHRIQLLQAAWNHNTSTGH